MRTTLSNRLRAGVATAVAAAVAAALALAGASPATAASSPPNGPTYGAQTFFAYAEEGELPTYVFTQQVGQTTPVTITTTDPEGHVQQQCVIPGGSPAGTICEATDLESSIEGIWTIAYDPGVPAPNARFRWDISVLDGTTRIPGRVWVENYELRQNDTNRTIFSLWIATREGYAYGVDFFGYGGIVSGIASNGFGLVQPGTCIPLYRSAPLGDPTVGFSDDCGDRYKLFLEAPDPDLPEEAQLPDGSMEWVRPDVVQPDATNVTLVQAGPFSRAGEIRFDLIGVNGGYTIQLDTNNDGDYTDPVDRTIPWGSPPGEISVPFDGLDGQGNPLSVCEPMNAKVVVDRVGEAHLVLNDVEQFWTSSQSGLRITGATPGIVGENPKLYWDDRIFPGEGALPTKDGRAGFDTSTTAAHGWGSWGDNRSIENWTYYQAQAGDPAVIPSACDPALTLEKNGELNDTNANGVADLGETIDYTFTVRNTGNAPVSGVAIDDDRVTGITPATADVPVFAEQEFTAAPYTVTQADIDAGGVPNVAVAAGTDPLGEDVISNEAEDFVPTTPRNPGLGLEKVASNDDANGNEVMDVGETIVYRFIVENTGNVTLEDVTIDDPRVTGVTPAAVDLAPGASQTFISAPYTVTQADVATGSVDNIAVARAASPVGEVESNTDSVSIPTPTPDPQIVLDKTAEITLDADSDGRADVGDTVTYTFEVENTGNLDVTGVTIDDPRIAGTTPASQDIPAGQTRSFTATYVATQDDVDFGSIPNTATAEGTYIGAGGPTPIVSAPDTEVVPTPERAPQLTLTKDGTLDDANSNGVADVGETIDYEFTVENIGNVTLENVTVFDDRVAAVTPGTATIAPGGQQVFTAVDYVVTQDDVDAGQVLNTAYARGNIPGGAEVLSEVDDHIEPTSEADPALTLEKNATLLDEDGNGTADAGEQIRYTFTVTNTGNVTLTDVTVEDARIAGLVPESIDFLPPTAQFIFQAELYTVTADDVEAGEIVNTASAVADDPDGTEVTSEEDTAIVTATPPTEDEPSAPALGATGADSSGLLATAAVTLLAGLALTGLRLARRRARRVTG